jgi:hypothetical protein
LRRYDKENLLWQFTVAIRSDPAGSPAGQPLTEAQYQEYAAKIDALGFIERRDRA